MADHILDGPVWSALATVHARFSLGSQSARRFQSDISPLSAARDEGLESLIESANLIGSTDRIIIGQANRIICPPDTRATIMITAWQMLFEDSKPQHRRGHAVEQLGENDAPAMMARAALTKPGSSVDRTHLLGEYWGIKQGGDWSQWPANV